MKKYLVDNKYFDKEQKAVNRFAKRILTKGKSEIKVYKETGSEIGNVFKTAEEAEFAVEKLKVEEELRKFSRPFKEDEYNYFIQINSSHNNIVIDSDDCYQTQGTIYFESTTIANEATDTVGADRIKKYIFKVEG